MDERVALLRLGLAKSALLEARQRRRAPSVEDAAQRRLASARTRAWYAELERQVALARKRPELVE